VFVALSKTFYGLVTLVLDKIKNYKKAGMK